MSDGWVIDPGDSNKGPVYELYRDGQLLMSCGDEFYKALMIHPTLKAMHEKIEENHTCSKCGGHGWSANCDECIPY